MTIHDRTWDPTKGEIWAFHEWAPKSLLSVSFLAHNSIGRYYLRVTR